MTIEDVLRETFTDREKHVADRELVAPVKARVDRQNRRRAAGAAVAVVAVLAGGSAVRALDAPAPSTPVAHQNTDGWVAHSSLGAQIRLPAQWEVVNAGCTGPGGPVFMRATAGGTGFECVYTTAGVAAFLGRIEHPPGIAFYGGPPQDVLEEVSAPRRLVTVDGVPGQRTSYVLANGLHAGWVKVPSRDVMLAVRTHSAGLTAAILDTLEFVTTDANGCAVENPEPFDPGYNASPPRTVPVAPPAARVAICYYGEGAQTLKASARMEGADADRLVAALNAAERGLNPDCSARPASAPPEYELVLFDRSDQYVANIEIRTEGCAGRGISNKGIRAVVTKSLVKTLAGAVHVGYSVMPDLPE